MEAVDEVRGMNPRGKGNRWRLSETEEFSRANKETATAAVAAKDGVRQAMPRGANGSSRYPDLKGYGRCTEERATVEAAAAA